MPWVPISGRHWGRNSNRVAGGVANGERLADAGDDGDLVRFALGADALVESPEPSLSGATPTSFLSLRVPMRPISGRPVTACGPTQHLHRFSSAGEGGGQVGREA